MRNHAVVVVDVEGDRSTDGGDAGQRVEEQPEMFQGAPPRFDIELENFSSVKASRRRRTPVWTILSTWVFTFSTPASASQTGAVFEAPRPDWRRAARSRC